jgi:hypothetical protein
VAERLDNVPTVEVGRVLFPGTSMGVPIGGADPAVPVAGAMVVATLSQAAIGVQAIVESARRLDEPAAPGDSGLAVVGLRGLARFQVEAGGSGRVSGVVSDPLGEGTPAQLERSVGALRRYLGALAERGHAADVMVEIPSEPLAASYRVASLLRISALEQQHLLEAPDAYQRLAALEVVLDRERRLLEATT